MDKVFQKLLQSGVDCSSVGVERHTDTEPTIPKWKVYFDGGFWGHSGKDHAGIEIRLDQQFEWAGHHWIIPAAYSCSKGLVVDFCMRTPAEDIRKFMKKWDLSLENDSCINFTKEQQLQIDLDNPLCIDFIPHLDLNGKIMQTSHGCSVTFNPCWPDGIINESEAKWALDYYGLDASFGWMIFRAAFPWTGKRCPEIKKLSLTMEQRSCCVPGPHFQIHAPGDQVTFYHPVSGTAYTLTVQNMEQQTLSKSNFGSSRYFYPTHFVAMRYTLSPETEENLIVCDCCDGDKPLKIAMEKDTFTPKAPDDACVSIIGGTDGPTAILAGEKVQDGLHTVCSSLHFEPVKDDIEWRVMFNIQYFDEAIFTLV